LDRGALIVVQVVLGAVTAHYGVEGSGFYGIPLSGWLSYVVTRTWHIQLGIFWIATAWLATGLFIAPAVSGVEPAYQRLGVNVLYVCLLIIVAGSMAGQWFAVQQQFGLATNFWFGHQGYEHVDLGRFWQLFLFAEEAAEDTAPMAALLSQSERELLTLREGKRLAPSRQLCCQASCYRLSDLAPNTRYFSQCEICTT
jgi:hypothetical protein